MDKEFFEKSLRKQVSVDYTAGGRNSFVRGEVLKVTDKFVTIANEDMMVSILYKSITSARTLTAKECE